MDIDKLNYALDNFEDENQENIPNSFDYNKRIVLSDREGLVERFDKIFITKDGKQLLREQY